MQNEFPKVKYHAVHGSITVPTPEAEATIGSDWQDSPVAPEPEKPADAPECPSCVAMRAKFDEAWKGLLEQKAAVEQENAALRADIEQLRGQLAEVTLAYNALKDAKAEEAPKRKKKNASAEEAGE